VNGSRDDSLFPKLITTSGIAMTFMILLLKIDLPQAYPLVFAAIGVWPAYALDRKLGQRKRRAREEDDDEPSR
jgi:hypothetical protein